MIAIVYATKNNRTRSVVGKLKDYLNFDYDIFDAKYFPDLTPYSIVLFFCPTYGDEELPESMEEYLKQFTFESKSFIICELGNYYGYDDYQFGSLKIIKHHLLSLGWKEVCRPLSLDSLPTVDWESLMKWAEEVNHVLQRDTVQ